MTTESIYTISGPTSGLTYCIYNDLGDILKQFNRHNFDIESVSVNDEHFTIQVDSRYATQTIENFLKFLDKSLNFDISNFLKV